MSHIAVLELGSCLKASIGVFFPELLLLSGEVMYSNLRESNVKVTGPYGDEYWDE